MMVLRLVFGLALILNLGPVQTAFALDLSQEKESCAALGFTPQTENFGKCVIAIVRSQNAAAPTAQEVAPAAPVLRPLTSAYQQQIIDLEKRRLALEQQRLKQQKSEALMNYGLGLINSGQPRRSNSTNCTVMDLGAVSHIDCN